MDNLSTAVLVFDKSLQLQYINLAAESLLAISGRQFHNAPLQDILIDGDADIQDIHQAMSEHRSYTKRRTQLHIINGLSLQVDYSVSPVHDLDGAAVLIEIQGLNYAERWSEGWPMRSRPLSAVSEEQLNYWPLSCQMAS